MYRDNVNLIPSSDPAKRIKKKAPKYQYKTIYDNGLKHSTQQIYSAPVKQFNNFFGTSSVVQSGSEKTRL